MGKDYNTVVAKGEGVFKMVSGVERGGCERTKDRSSNCSVKRDLPMDRTPCDDEFIYSSLLHYSIE